MKEFNTGGKKDLTGKLPVHLVTKYMIDGIAEGLLCGMKKGYDANNWQLGLNICEGHLGAALRHMFKYMSGEDINIEHGKNGEEVITHHLDNALTHLAMAVHQIKSGRIDLDDRFKLPEPTKAIDTTSNIGIRFKYSHSLGESAEYAEFKSN